MAEEQRTDVWDVAGTMAFGQRAPGSVYLFTIFENPYDQNTLVIFFLHVQQKHLKFLPKKKKEAPKIQIG